MKKYAPLSIGVLLCIGLGVMYTKYYVASLRMRVLDQEKKCTELQNNIHLLSLEWAYLNAPERLEKLCTEFLDLSPPQNNQIRGDL